MNKNVTTMLMDLGVLAALTAISLGIWFYPWLTLLALVLLASGGCLFDKKEK